VLPRSTVPGVVWPALPDAPTAGLLALLWQLDQTQWWPAARLAEAQARQLRLVVEHARATVPHYRDTIADPSRIPVVTRDQLIAAGPRLRSQGYPGPHGPVEEILTSRTTGEPVRLHSTGVTRSFWSAITLRDHAWHRRDLGARLAAIRYVGGGEAAPPDGLRRAGWGPATDRLAPDAPLSLLSIASTTEQQVDWLLREDPAYLLTYPSALDAILRRLADRGARLPSLRQVRTIGEALPAELRARCAAQLGAPVVDVYSAQEVGYIALQCPDGDGYHVMAERLVVEVLDDDGAPCRPGAIGRVVVSDLHNFATPILRYQLGDLAEVGAPCRCGRGLPVLTRIVGRRRNMLTYPDGRTTWPLFAIPCRQAARYRELQLVQETVDTLRARVVPDGPLDHAALIAALHGCLGHRFRIEIEEVEALSRSPAGKLEEFVSRVIIGG
jgi:phenylacetate-CoA ligase